MKRIVLSILAMCICPLVGQTAHAQWQLQTTLDGNPPVSCVNTVSDRVAWIVGADTVYRTTNGGGNWSRTATMPTSTEVPGCVDALDATTACVGGAGPGSQGGDAKIYRTTNGGQSWSIVYTGVGTTSYWNAIHFFDSQNGIALSDPPDAGNTFLMVKSADGGTTWTPIAHRPLANTGEFGIYNTLYFYDTPNGWFGTSRGRVFRTTDGGENWTGFASGNTDAVYGIRFVSPTVGIRISPSPPFLTRSTDGGQTWATVNNLPVSNISYMSSATGVNTPSLSQLWVDGRTTTKPFVLTSVDGGTTWQDQPLPILLSGTVPLLSAVTFGALRDSVQAFGATYNFTSAANGGQILSYRQGTGFVTGINEQTNLPAAYSLSQNYPNPFNPATTIKYDLPRDSYVTLRIYDILGREVKTLADEVQLAGYKNTQWNSTNNLGNQVASGVYFYRLQAGEFVQTRKLLLLK